MMRKILRNSKKYYRKTFKKTVVENDCSGKISHFFIHVPKPGDIFEEILSNSNKVVKRF